MINWDLLGPPVDIGAHFQAGLEKGRAMRRQAATESALAAYAKDPTNPESENALAALSPEFAMNLGQRRSQKASQQAERQRIGRYFNNPDLSASRTEALQAGDIDVAKQIDALDGDTKKKIAGMYKAAAPLAYQALKLPPDQRKAFIETARPQLVANGWTDQQIDAFDPSDANLGVIVQGNMTLDQAMDRDKINYKEVGPGARLVPFDSTGRPVGADAGQAAAGPAGEAEGAVATALSSGGLPAAVVAGFLGNFEVEGGYGGASGDGGTASGIAQWRGERQTNFQRVIGKPVSIATPEEQAQFVLWEMQNPEAAGMTVAKRDAILAARTPAEAAELIDRHYERSDGKHRSRRVAAANRLAGANSNPTDILAKAQEAIAAGADPVKVRERAASMGVTM